MASAPRDPTYAIAWRDGDGPTQVGKLELRDDGIHLEGGSVGGRLFATTLRYRDISGLRMARTGRAERLNGRPTLLLQRAGRSSLRIASVEGLGSTTEIFARVARLVPACAAA
ncbi:MAG TPA: hypothetical protein VFW80_06660 [Gaiellaceae bacterium]|nr:hypothetical protein [Gaiellaceae bacterium]